MGKKASLSGGNTPYGYKRKGDSLVNLEEVEIIRSIYTSAKPGMSGRVIADSLNQDGLLKRNGSPWTQRQVAKILKRERLYQ